MLAGLGAPVFDQKLQRRAAVLRKIGAGIDARGVDAVRIEPARAVEDFARHQPRLEAVRVGDDDNGQIFGGYAAEFGQEARHQPAMADGVEAPPRQTLQAASVEIRRAVGERPGLRQFVERPRPMLRPGDHVVEARAQPAFAAAGPCVDRARVTVLAQEISVRHARDDFVVARTEARPGHARGRQDARGQDFGEGPAFDALGRFLQQREIRVAVVEVGPGREVPNRLALDQIEQCGARHGNGEVAAAERERLHQVGQARDVAHQLLERNSGQRFGLEIDPPFVGEHAHRKTREMLGDRGNGHRGLGGQLRAKLQARETESPAPQRARTADDADRRSRRVR